MSLPDGVSLREATHDDLPAIAALRRGADWSVHDWAMRAVVGAADATFVIAVADGRPVAMGSGIAYRPALGFIGNMVVVDDFRRRGVGTAILDSVVEWLERAGCTRLELNATPDGSLLYARHGFVSRGISRFARVPRAAVAARHDARVRPMRRDDQANLAAFDAPRFGGDRSRLLGVLADESVARGFVADVGGTLGGFAFLQADDRRLGPMVADAPGVAAALIAAVFAAHPHLADVRVNLPPGNESGAAWLAGLGIDVESWDGRMARGPDVPRRDEAIYQMTVGPLG